MYSIMVSIGKKIYLADVDHFHRIQTQNYRYYAIFFRRGKREKNKSYNNKEYYVTFGTIRQIPYVYNGNFITFNIEHKNTSDLTALLLIFETNYITHQFNYEKDYYGVISTPYFCDGYEPG